MKEYRILKTFKGSQHGYDQPKEFVEGTLALLSDTLAAAAIDAGEAEPLEASKGAKAPSTGGGTAKASKGAPENKALDGAPKNKA